MPSGHYRNGHALDGSNTCAFKWKFSGHSQRPPFPNPVSPRSESKEFPEKKGQAPIRRNNIAQHLVTEGDIQVAKTTFFGEAEPHNSRIKSPAACGKSSGSN